MSSCDNSRTIRIHNHVFTMAEYVEMRNEAISALTSRKLNPEDAVFYSATDTINHLKKLGFVNKTLDKSGKFKVSRGRFASDLIEQQGLEEIRRINQAFRKKYMINDDILITDQVHPRYGYTVEINKMAEKFANDKVRDNFYKRPYTAQEIRDYVLMLADFKIMQSYNTNLNETGYDPAIKINKAEFDTPSYKLKNLILYKKSLFSTLQIQLSKVNASLNNREKLSEEEVENLIRTKEDLTLRLYGNGSNQNSDEYVLNLKDDLTYLEAIENTNTPAPRNYVISGLLYDLHRLDKLISELKNSESPVEKINNISEARLILRLLKAYSDSNNTIASVYQNPFFTTGEMKAIRNETASPIMMNMKNNLDKIIDRMAKNHYGTDLELIEIKLIEELMDSSKKLKNYYGDDFTFENVFNATMDDMHWYDSIFSNGIIGTITNLGPIPQMEEEFLTRTMNKYESRFVYWENKMNNILPKTNASLKKLGHGLGHGLLGVSYNIFRQDTPNGKSNQLISKESFEYSEKESRIVDTFWRKIKNGKGTSSVVRAAHNERNEWRKRNSIAVDPRKLRVIFDNKNGEFDMFQKYLIPSEFGNHQEELEKHLKSDKAVKRAIDNQVKLVKNYKSEYNRFLKDLLFMNDVESVEDLDEVEKHKLEVFEAKNNPFIISENYAKKQFTTIKGEIIFPNLDVYTSFIPKRYKVTSNRLITDSNGEKNYDESNEETDYYDKNFEIIENDDALYEFYELADGMLSEFSKMLPPEMQKTLKDNTFLGIKKALSEILLDSDVPVLHRIAPAIASLANKWKSMVQTKVDNNQTNNIVDALSGEMSQEVNTSFVKSNKGEITKLFRLKNMQFFQSLSTSAQNNIKFKNKMSELKRTTVVPYSEFSPESKKILAEALNCESDDVSLLSKLEAKQSDLIPVGRILYNYAMKTVVKDETYNIPAMLKLYAIGATNYAARQEVEPILKIVKEKYEQIKKPEKTADNKIVKTGTDEDSREVLAGVRTNAIEASKKWHNRNVYNKKIGKTYGVRSEEAVKRKHLSSYNKKIYDEAQKIIDKELSKPSEKQDIKLLEQAYNIQKSLGGRFAISRVVDTLMIGPVRFIGLGINLKGAIGNYLAGKLSNYLMSKRNIYFSEKSMMEAERIVLASHLNLLWVNKIWRGITSNPKKGIPGKPLFKESSKATVLMSRYDILQDATDEYYRAALNTAVNFKKYGNAYILQQLTEYVNQTPVMIAIAKETKIKDKNGKEGILWDVLDENGRLKGDFATPENIQNWEKADGEEYNNFKEKVTGAINDTHGDYTSKGTPLAADKQGFKIMMMFRRWQITLLRTFIGVEQYQYDLNRVTKGRLRSYTPSLGAVTGTVLATVVFGPQLYFIASGALAGAFLTNHLQGNKLSTINDFKNAISYYITDLSKVVANGIANPIMIPLRVLSGNKIRFTGKLGRFMNESHESDTELDRGNNASSIASLSMTVSALLLRLLLLASKNRMDDDDDSYEAEQKRRLLNLTINTAGQVLDETIMFYNVLKSGHSFLNPPFFRLFDKAAELLKQLKDYDEVYVQGKNEGRNKLLSMTRKTLAPSLFRKNAGFEPAMDRVFQEYGADDLFLNDTEKIEKDFKQNRAKVKLKIKEEIEKEVNDNVDNFIKALEKKKPDLYKNESKKTIKSRARKEMYDAVLSSKRAKNILEAYGPTFNQFVKRMSYQATYEAMEKYPDLFKKNSDEAVFKVLKEYKKGMEKEVEKFLDDGDIVNFTDIITNMEADYEKN